jgi:hypothetical protein
MILRRPFRDRWSRRGNGAARSIASSKMSIRKPVAPGVDEKSPFRAQPWRHEHYNVLSKTRATYALTVYLM